MFFIHGLFAVLIIFSSTSAAGERNPSPLAQDPTTANIRSRISRKDLWSDNENKSKSPSIMLPNPGPSQTVGDYLDNVDSILKDTSSDAQTESKSLPELTQRSFVRTHDFRKSVWSDGTEHYNISISQCIHFSEIIGKWTNLDGTTQAQATLSNITSDLNTRFHSQTELSNHLKSRLLANAELAASEASASLQSTLCNYAPTPSSSSSSSPSSHDNELRKLLAPTPLDHLNTKFLAIDGYWTGILMSMGAGATVGGTLYKGFYNHNATAGNVALTAFTAAGLIFVRGVIERLYMNGTLHYMEASVIAAFTAWFRQAVALAVSLQTAFLQQVGADQANSGCLEEVVVESGVEGLRGYEEPGAYIIELVPMGRC